MKRWQTPSLLRWSAFIAFGGVVTVAPCRASIWQSNDWAVASTVEGVVGYDSNLTTSPDGPEDFFAVAKPSLTLFRRNSSTDFRISGGVAHTEFLNGHEPSQTDLTFDAVYAYPNSNLYIPIYRAEAAWSRKTQPNEYLGERVRIEQPSFKAEGFLPLTGKLGLRGTTDIEAANYDKTRLNNNSRSEVFAGLAYKRTERTEISLNLGGAYAQSIPNDAARTSADVRSNEYYVTAQIRGELTPKISGNIYGGLGRVDYRGGYVNRYYLPVGGADLTWGFDPRRTLVLAMYSGATYSPDGNAADRTQVFLSFTHVIISRWQYILRAGPTRAVFRREVRWRTDNSWDGGVEFVYNPSNRFRVALGLNYTNQKSDISAYAFDRNVASLGASYHF